MMMASNLSITASQPVPSPAGLTDEEVRLPDLKAAVRDDTILSRSIAIRSEMPCRVPTMPQREQKGPAQGEITTCDDIQTRDLPSWLLACIPRLLRLCDMKPNWDSYGSPPPSLALAKGIIRWLPLAEIEALPEPEVVPASAGGIQLEWYLGKRDLEIEFTPTGQIEYLRSDKERNEEKEDVIKDLNDLRCLLAWLIG